MSINTVISHSFDLTLWWSLRPRLDRALDKINHTIKTNGSFCFCTYYSSHGEPSKKHWKLYQFHYTIVYIIRTSHAVWIYLCHCSRAVCKVTCLEKVSNFMEVIIPNYCSWSSEFYTFFSDTIQEIIFQFALFIAFLCDIFLNRSKIESKNDIWISYFTKSKVVLKALSQLAKISVLGQARGLPVQSRWGYIPATTKHVYNICTTSAQRLRRWSNIVQMLYTCFVFAGRP